MGWLRSRLVFALLLAIAAGLPSIAVAQTVDALTTSAGNFDRDRSVAVLDRKHPELDPQGVALGSFRLLPKIDLTALYTDNIYATDSARRGDAFGIVDPSFRLNSNWSRHRLSIGGDAALVRYADATRQNVETYDTNAFGQLDVSDRLALRSYVDYGRLAERRSDIGVPNTTASPILYTILNANGSAQWQSSRFKLVGTAAVTTLRYKDNITREGVAAPQGYRDRNSYRVTARGEYALTPDLSLLAQGTLTQARFTHPELSTFNRNSNRQELLGGISMELTELIRAEVGVGYIHLRYTAANLPRFSGVGGRVQVEFFPSQLTTVTARASRTIEDSGLPSAPTYVRTIVGAQVDHELLRNLVLSASAAYSNNDFTLQGRQEHRPEFFVRGTYTLSRHLSLSARYDRIDSRARPIDSGKTFALNQLSLSISMRL